jgi:hypothetical protein
MTPPHSKILDANSFVQYDPLLHDPHDAISIKQTLINTAIKHNIPYTTDLYVFTHDDEPNNPANPRLLPSAYKSPVACLTHHYSVVVLRLRSGKTVSYDTRFNSLRIVITGPADSTPDQYITPPQALHIMQQHLILETIYLTMTPHQIIQTINAPPILKLPHNLPVRIHLSLMSRSFRPKPLQSTIKYAPTLPPMNTVPDADYIILYYKDFRVHVTQDTAMIFTIKRTPSDQRDYDTTSIPGQKYQHNNTIKAIQLLIKQEKAIRSI